MTEYKVRGESESGVESLLPLEEGKLVVRQAVRIDPTVRADGPTAKLDIGDDDLLEVELASGFVLWTTVDRLQEDTRRGATRAGDDPLLLPVGYPLERPGAQRGFVADAIQSLKVLGYDLPEEGARAVAEKIERQLEGDGKLFLVSKKGDLYPEAPALDPDKPTLVLIHGTASSTANAYGGLFSENSATWAEIHDRYEERVYGFEHRTLSQSPLENALDFFGSIPSNARLHLVSHSRGGLVGDLIAHGGVTGDAFSLEDVDRELALAVKQKRFTKEDARRQLELYREFNRVVQEKAPRVERFVRVGCPAAGTTLASGRLDIYLSILINLVRQVPGVGPFVGGLGELAAAVAKERTDPDVLPGLEAQMPKSAFVRLLNASEHELESDLTVLAGDSDGFVKNLANLFYWQANDLVVDTRSMYGGAPRRRRLWHLEENRHVTHVNYFKRFETAQVVRRGLLREDSDLGGFEARIPKGVARGHVDIGEPDENVQLPGVILVPGVMGSHLRVIDEQAQIDNRVWLDKSDLMKGRGALLEMGKHEIKPDGVLKRAYDDFRDYLARHGLHVMPMAFDWRASLALAAQLLNDLATKRLNASSEPLYVIAHSMGGIVASLFMAEHDDTWQRLKKSGGRLVQAGTPNLGSYVIPRILQGEEKMIRFLAGLDLANGVQKWANWSARFPGLLEMAPNFDSLDFSQRQTWEGLGVLAAPRVTDLRAAKAVRDKIAAQTAKLADEGVRYVAGGPEETPVYDPEAGRIRFTMQGDGRVTWGSGIPPGAPTWYIPAKHGSLLDKKSAFAGLRELLIDGTTNQLSTERPAASSLLLRGEESATPQLAAADDQVEYIPTSDDLEEAALGMDESYGRVESGPPVPPCKVQVVHGDLRFVDNPVVVGHYRGDPIVHAEAVLDSCLRGALRSRHQLELYPGEIGTAEAVLKRDERLADEERGPRGAIVLGLGNVGELTTGGLIRSVETGLLRYVQTCHDRGTETSSLKLSALLVGSGEAGLTVAQIVEAFVTATGNVNRQLERVRVSKEEQGEEAVLAHISHIEFIELYRDVALEALHALRALPAKTGFEISGQLESRGGGRQRARITSPSGWWLPLSIRSEELPAEYGSTHSGLKFTAYGERARVGVTRVVLQTRLIDGFLAEAIRNGKATESRPPETLFELLVPPELKSTAMGQANDLQLVLDEGSAAYPWELLVDRMSSSGDPLGVDSGLLRQLRVENPSVVSHPEDNRILVVGDPPSGMQRLPGARKEAAHVADIFKQQGWSVVEQIRKESGAPGISASSVIGTLLNTDARILHLAGHGVYDPSSAMGSGMVLGGGAGPDDPYLLLTPSEVSQMRLQPELVFINCCHLGRIQRTRAAPLLHRLAANLAAQFIRSGVKAVVAAGWPVDDAAASTFCDALYGSLLKGEGFGKAVKWARQRTYASHPRTNTWGAYQCYGDPGLRLLMDVKVRARITRRYYRPSDFVDVSELLIELENLISWARVESKESGKEKVAAYRDDLRQLAERKGWLGKSGVLAGIARVHGELGDFKIAVEVFGEALRLEEGGVTITDLEQLANYRVRHGKKEKSAEIVAKGIEELERLLDQHGETAERLSLLAASHKRMAQVDKQSVASVRESLREMTAQYVRAAELKSDNWYYPATNALLGVVLLGGPRASARGANAARDLAEISWADVDTFDERLAATDAYVQSLGIDDFWTAVAPIDLDVVRSLAEGDLADRVGDLVRRYRQAMELCGSGREIDSVKSNWQFAERMAKKLRLGARTRALSSLTEELES